MPSPVRPRVIPQRHGPGNGPIVVPARVAEALDPAGSTRRYIPERVRLGTDAPPFSGELREDDGKFLRQPLAVGAAASLGMLTRAWNYVGFMIDPGNAAAGGVGLVVQLVVFAANMRAPLPDILVTLGIGPRSFPVQLVGARVELVAINQTVAPIRNLRGAIWGMSEH